MIVCRIDFASPEYDEAVALRYEVLRRPLGLHYTEQQLAAEWDNYHIAAFLPSGQMAGYLNLTPVTPDEVKMRQVAVLPELQGKGIGQQMVHYSEQLAHSLGFQKITLHARKTAIPFYLKLGYTTVGDEFEEVNIPHFKMWKQV